MRTKLIAAVFALLVTAISAPAQRAAAPDITGVYNGSYAGEQGPIKFKLAITPQDNGKLVGVFTLYLPEGSGTKEYTSAVSGWYIPAKRMIQVRLGQWETPPPGDASLTGMDGQFDPEAGNGAGQISGRLTARNGAQFQAIREAQKSAAPTSSAPVPIVNWRTAISGVYQGTYGSNPDDKVPAKLYVKFIENGSVNGVLDGLFTFEVPPSAGAEPITYTYQLTGETQPGNGSGFHSAKPVGKPAPDVYAVTQLWVYFVRSLDYGRSGKLESSFNPDQITGKVFGSHGLPSPNQLEAVRDKDASAKLDSLMAAAQASAASAVSTTAPAVAVAGAPAHPSSSPPSSGASTDIDNVMGAVHGYWGSAPAAPAVRPSIEGVFNGTYTRENEPPTKFKLTITHTPDGRLAGVATIYLPTDSGTRAYTYSLLGSEDYHGAFHLLASEWDTIPPKDFKDFKTMGFNGTFLSNLNQNRARIISAPGSLAALCVGQFEAAWDATESADTKGAIAAQKALGDADQAAALKAHAEVLKNAKPKQLASKDLVRKSKAYWAGYRSDFIREIFDGGFASDVGDDTAFQSLFTQYVELFSKNCAAYLPADHKTVTITTTTTTTYPGGPYTTSTTSETLEMDPRFIAKYAEYVGVEPAPGSEQEKEQTAKTIAVAGQIFHAGGPSHGTSPADANALLHLMAAHGLMGGAGMDTFFATEVKATGPSVALRQMGENLLRGATGEPSLQEAGAKIAGAQAETDKDLPPGRFARLVDAAHAFYRDPANARLSGRFETAFDETLAAKYHGVMTPEEEYYYANDFEGRFRNQIMQPRAYCTDPAWVRLHPMVQKCVEELGQ